MSFSWAIWALIASLMLSPAESVAEEGYKALLPTADDKRNETIYTKAPPDEACSPLPEPLQAINSESALIFVPLSERKFQSQPPLPPDYPKASDVCPDFLEPAVEFRDLVWSEATGAFLIKANHYRAQYFDILTTTALDKVKGHGWSSLDLEYAKSVGSVECNSDIDVSCNGVSVAKFIREVDTLFETCWKRDSSAVFDVNFYGMQWYFAGIVAHVHSHRQPQMELSRCIVTDAHNPEWGRLDVELHHTFAPRQLSWSLTAAHKYMPHKTEARWQDFKLRAEQFLQRLAQGKEHEARHLAFLQKALRDSEDIRANIIAGRQCAAGDPVFECPQNHGPVSISEQNKFHHHWLEESFKLLGAKDQDGEDDCAKLTDAFSSAQYFSQESITTMSGFYDVVYNGQFRKTKQLRAMGGFKNVDADRVHFTMSRVDYFASALETLAFFQELLTKFEDKAGSKTEEADFSLFILKSSKYLQRILKALQQAISATPEFCPKVYEEAIDFGLLGYKSDFTPNGGNTPMDLLGSALTTLESVRSQLRGKLETLQDVQDDGHELIPVTLVSAKELWVPGVAQKWRKCSADVKQWVEIFMTPKGDGDGPQQAQQRQVATRMSSAERHRCQEQAMACIGIATHGVGHAKHYKWHKSVKEEEPILEAMAIHARKHHSWVDSTVPVYENLGTPENPLPNAEKLKKGIQEGLENCILNTGIDGDMLGPHSWAPVIEAGNEFHARVLALTALVMDGGFGDPYIRSPAALRVDRVSKRFERLVQGILNKPQQQQ